MERLTAMIYGYAHGAEGVSKDKLTGRYCRGEFESTACIDRLGEYENLEEQGLLVKLPCKVGDTVYIVAECGNITPQLDGTWYSADGSPGTATGYYCPYENKCPHDCDEFTVCEDYKHKKTIFEDIVSLIEIDKNGIRIFTENIGAGGWLNDGCIFSTREQGEKSLNEMENK